MKAAAVIVLASVTLLFGSAASAKEIPIHFASRTVSCHITAIQFSIGSAVGAITFNGANNPYVTATTRGAWINSICRTLHVRTQPKALLPHPSYPGDGTFECVTPSPLIIHVHYLRSGGQVSGIYASARTRSGRYIAAGLLTSSGVEREYVAPSCTASG